MGIDGLITNLQERGVTFTLCGDRFTVAAPPGVLAPDDRAALAEHRDAILSHLAAANEDALPAAAPPLPAFRFVDGDMEHGDIAAGWTPAAWAAELRRKARCCRRDHPDTAERYTRWATDIEDRLPPLAVADTLPPERREWYEERAAIREFDGEQDRETAERAALAEVLAEMERQNFR